MFGPEHHNHEHREHHHGDGLGEQAQLLDDIVVENTKPCELQQEMHKTRIGKKFLALFEHLCKKGTEPQMLDMLFGNPNYQANMENEGFKDHFYAIKVLEKLKLEEREQLYELVENFIDKGQDFKFDKKHNMFQELKHQEKDFNDLLNFDLNSFDNMAMRDFNYYEERISYGFAKNLLVGAHFDNITNIRLQSYRHNSFNQNPNIGFYIYVGEDNENIQTHFFDCEHESGKSFKITKVTNQDGLMPSFLGFGSESIPDKDEHGSYFKGLKDEFEVDGKKIFIDKDPFSDKDGGEKIELEKEKEPRPSKSNDEPEPVTDETKPVTDEKDSNKNNEVIVGGKRKTKKRKNKTKKRKNKTKKGGKKRNTRKRTTRKKN